MPRDPRAHPRSPRLSGTSTVTSSPRTVRAVVFDWDGTLVDSHRALWRSLRGATSSVIGELVPATKADHCLALQLGERQSFNLLTQDAGELDRLVETFRHLYRDESRGSARLYPGVPTLLRRLRGAGIRVAVLSNGDAGRVRGEAERLGVAALVDLFVTGDDVDVRVPNPLPILQALERLGVSPTQALYVGDDPLDVIGGHAAGVLTVAALHGGDAEAIRQEHPWSVVRSVPQLLDLLAEDATGR